MPLETELKLSLQPADRHRLLAHPLLHARPPERLHLHNTYFDTPTLALMGQRIAVRERRVGDQTLLTVKTAGRSVGGLSQRLEWESPTRPGAFDFAALVDDAALAHTLGALAAQLAPVFHTDFVRLRWVIAHPGAHGDASIELALDEGTVSTDANAPHGRQQQALLELELELLSGPVEALFELASALAAAPPGDVSPGIHLQPSQRSKAERGFDLFLGRGVTSEPTRGT
jgi:inorganic triphosphatase YgiF